MGITGLIPFLEKASSKVNLKDLRGTTVAIDSYCWLHKGVYSCADKLVRGEDSNQYITYCLKYVQMLLSYNIKPIMVFDGQHLPAKALTEKRRRESRRESKKRAAELLRLGKIEEARSHMRRCVDVTHDMALRLIQECRLRNVDCIVAPYEADAQMAWLNKADIAQYVITEDSDLTLFGARNIIFKLDLSGNGLLVEAEKLHLAMGCNKERYNFDKFRRMCILSGCDYLDSLPGIGLAKACKFMLKTEEENMCIALKKIPQYLNMKQLQVDDEYIENFLKAEATFKHMYVFNPIERKMERLNALEIFQTDEKFCSNAGSPIDNDEIALHMALGNLNPFSLKQMDTWLPEFGLKQAPPKNIKRAKHKSIWQTEFKTESPSKNSLQKQKSSSCALYFKKVDFISKTIEQDISENLIVENAKPAEKDIFALYKEEAHDQLKVSEPNRKRRCSDSSSSDNAAPSQPTPQLTRHNPFAKSLGSSNDKGNSSKAAICRNGSLLKVLSPKKLNQETKRVSSFRRSIFVAEEEKVEVRSRFFAENVKLVQKTSAASLSNLNTTVKSTVDVTDEIEYIEKLSQQHEDSQALLYHSPSPQKSIKRKYSAENLQPECVPLSHTDSGIESLTTENNDISSQEVDQKLLPKTIDISDDDEDIESNDRQKDTNLTSKPKVFKLDTYSNQKAPRMGLSKSKSKNQKSKSIRNVISSNNSSQMQTRLSMFGFQKRPNLK